VNVYRTLFILFSIVEFAGWHSKSDKDNQFDGGWKGNGTISRTTIDLNNILYFYSI